MGNRGPGEHSAVRMDGCVFVDIPIENTCFYRMARDTLKHIT